MLAKNLRNRGKKILRGMSHFVFEMHAPHTKMISIYSTLVIIQGLAIVVGRMRHYTLRTRMKTLTMKTKTA